MFRRLITKKNTHSGKTSEPLPTSTIALPGPPAHDLAQLAPRLLDELRSIVGSEHVLSDEADLIAYSIDGTWIERRPLAVVLPAIASTVSAILKLANRERIRAAPLCSARRV